MKKILFITLGFFLVLIFAWFVLGKMFSHPNPTPKMVEIPAPYTPAPQNPQQPNTQPGVVVTGQPPPQNTVAIPGQAGTLQINDFRLDPHTTQDAANKNFYYLAFHTFGSGATPDAPFFIAFDTTTGTFTIALNQEPIKQTRLEMEQYLMAELGLSQAQMCQLKYTVSVPGSVNEYYAGANLLFSFCPGATIIP